MYGADTGPADPIQLVRNAALVGVHAQPRPTRRHPVGFVGPHPGGSHPGLGQSALPLTLLTARHQQFQRVLAGGTTNEAPGISERLRRSTGRFDQPQLSEDGRAVPLGTQQ
nr:hypothetical protein CPGR_04956 [Mycolicibacter nonchromogenicus]